MLIRLEYEFAFTSSVVKFPFLYFCSEFLFSVYGVPSLYQVISIQYVLNLVSFPVQYPCYCFFSLV